MITDYHGRSVRMAPYPMVDSNLVLKLQVSLLCRISKDRN